MSAGDVYVNRPKQWGLIQPAPSAQRSAVEQPLLAEPEPLLPPSRFVVQKKGYGYDPWTKSSFLTDAKLRWWCYRPDMSIWHCAIHYTAGSVLFTFASVCMLFHRVHDDVNLDRWTYCYPYALGSVMYTIGSTILVMESWKNHPDKKEAPPFQHQGDVSVSRSVIRAVSIYHGRDGRDSSFSSSLPQSGRQTPHGDGLMGLVSRSLSYSYSRGGLDAREGGDGSLRGQDRDGDHASDGGSSSDDYLFSSSTPLIDHPGPTSSMKNLDMSSVQSRDTGLEHTTSGGYQESDRDLSPSSSPTDVTSSTADIGAAPSWFGPGPELETVAEEAPLKAGAPITPWTVTQASTSTLESGSTTGTEQQQKGSEGQAIAAQEAVGAQREIARLSGLGKECVVAGDGAGVPVSVTVEQLGKGDAAEDGTLDAEVSGRPLSVSSRTSVSGTRIPALPPVGLQRNSSTKTFEKSPEEAASSIPVRREADLNFALAMHHCRDPYYHIRKDPWYRTRWMLDVLGSVSIWIGAVLYNVSCFTLGYEAWFGHLPDIGIFSTDADREFWLEALPDDVGGALFIVGSWFFWWSGHGTPWPLGPKMFTLLWWVTVCNFFGSVGFFLGAVVTTPIAPMKPLVSDWVELTVGYALGSLLFTVGSYGMLVEVASFKVPEKEEEEAPVSAPSNWRSVVTWIPYRFYCRRHEGQAASDGSNAV